MGEFISRRRFVAGAAAGLGAAAVAGAMGAAATKPLKAGELAPEFALPDQHGKVRRLADYRGRTVVLAFYLKDFTYG